MEKENNIQKAVRQRDEVLNIICKNFMKFESGEDNSWRANHNLLVFHGQIEVELFDYFAYKI